MCKETFSVYAPCAHWVYHGETKCPDAGSLKGIFKKEILSKESCKLLTGLQFIIDWCPECKAGFAKVIRNMKTTVPAGYRSLWDTRLINRYWAAKSQLRCSWAVDASTIGHQVFASEDWIEYVPFIRSEHHGEAKYGFWELTALKNEVWRLKPTSVWIKNDPHGPACELDEQLEFCQRALDHTANRAAGRGQVV
jgi:hypothetical protein